MALEFSGRTSKVSDMEIKHVTDIRNMHMGSYMKSFPWLCSRDMCIGRQKRSGGTNFDEICSGHW